MLDAAFRPILYDCLCVFFLTLSSAARGRVAGEAPTGCFLLAVFSALTYPVGRELLLNGSCLAVFSSFPHQLSLLAGAFLGTLLLSFGRFFDRFLPLLDLTALALTSSFTVLCVLPRCDPPAALLLAFFLSLFPQLVTDLALGIGAQSERLDAVEVFLDFIWNE